MISYSIAPSIFEPPNISFIDNIKKIETNEKTILNNQIIDLHDNVRKINELKDNEDKIILIFNTTKITFDVEYMKKANRVSGLPIDKLKIILNKLESNYFQDYVSNNRKSIKGRYFTFEDWFKFDKLEYENITFQPPLQKKINDSYDINESIIKIGVINNYIYKSSFFHFLIDKQTIKYTYECKKIEYNIKEETIKKELFSSEVQVINISEIISNKEKKYRSVLDAYKNAKELFSDYIIFGDDVEKGIRTIEKDAGPPDRIFAYLQTLKEFTKYKRENNTEITDDYILTALGCNCSYERSKHMKDEKVIKERMFDNGNKQKILFELHLKPNTYNIYGTIRIHISWDEKQKKVIVGWIGKHLYLPPKNP